MTSSDYTVASATQLLGAKPPKRREADERYWTRMQEIDEANRKCSALKRTGNVKTVHFDDDEGIAGNRDALAPGPRAASSPSGQNGGEDVTPVNNEDGKASYITHRGAVQELAKARHARRGVVVVESSPLRVQELRAEQTLPHRHQHRIEQTRIDTSVATADASHPSPSQGIEVAGLRRNASYSSRKTRRDSQVTELYFSPIEISSCDFSLTDPIVEPEELLTPTQARYDDERRWSAGDNQPLHDTEPPEEPEAKLMLKPEQVDRLVQALAESPLMKVHVSRQWWDEVGSETATVLSETDVPSLSAPSTPSTMYSQPNQTFMTEQRSPSVTQEILEEEFAREYPDHPRAKPSTPHAQTYFGGIAMVDPKVHGSPIRFVSKGYQLGANVLQVGACSFLNIPYGATVQSNLRIEPPSTRSINCRVMLQVVNQVLERRTGRKAYLLVAELDVTDSFIKAALMELSAHSDISLDDIEMIAPGIRAMHKAELDWCALADEVQTSLNIRDVVEAAATSFARLQAEDCTMQTLTLMSELERMKTQHQDFLALRPTGHHKNGMISGIYIPWTSQHLDQLLCESDPDNIRGEASKASRLLRDRVVGAVAEGCLGERPFDTRIWWGDRLRRVHCVPLHEGMEGPPEAWVAFLSDLDRRDVSLSEIYRLGYMC